jgi:hypothetical protein
MKNKKQDNEYLNISDSFLTQSDAPFYGSADDLITISKLTEEYFKSVQELNNPRHVILETWLLVDFTIRTFLSYLFDLTKFNSEEKLDLSYELLPSFERSIAILKKVLKIQRSLPENPEDNSVKLPAKFGIFFMRKHKTEFKKFLDIEQEYYKKYFPELTSNNKEKIKVSIQSKADTSKTPKRYCVDKYFVRNLQSIDENWFKIALRLNKARNISAHSYDSQKILSAFGYKGKKAVERTKKECLTIIEKLLGIVIDN